MSLVNDMLRDLDRRRKESTGSAASVSLTPAPEAPPKSGNRPALVYLIAALILSAGAIAWFWLQQDGGGTTRELNIAPRLVSEPSAITPEQTAEELAQDREASEVIAQAPLAEPVAAGNTVSGVAEAPVVRSASSSSPSALPQNSQQQSVSNGVDAAGNPQGEPALAEIASSTPAAPQASANAPGVANGSTTVASEPVQVSSSPGSDTAAQTTVDLSQSPEGEVKNAAQLSPDEQDVLAVQQALQLIADNKTAEAYATLEQEILDNRYALQTRETYAKLLMNEGNLLGAFELNEAGLALSPNHPGFKKIKERLLIAQGLLNEAVDLLLTRAPSVDADLEYHEILATAQLASRDYEGALISYSGLVRQDQSQGKWWYGFAASQDSLGNTSAARQGYSRAVSMSNLSANLRRRSQERLCGVEPVSEWPLRSSQFE